jgi:regulator of protease activity HflC (stomatin/prohibitin superfamily)
MVEHKAWKLNGFLGVLLVLLFIGAAVYFFDGDNIVAEIVLILLSLLVLSGINVVHPNEAKAVTFFGRYVGSIRESGIWLTYPISARTKISLRVRNFNSKILKVNDVEGNPVEIAAVVVFKVIDSAKAIFSVDDYEQFVEIQSEAALRHVAAKYPYDSFDQEGYSLRGNAEEVAGELARELQERLKDAGVKVIEARLTHLAYSTEIASAMLQRQQASAILAARQIIVEGAVGMAQMAIAQLQQDNIIELDEERKVMMINNLLVAIVSDRSSQPVINVGSLY